jgi:hypothetical protein
MKKLTLTFCALTALLIVAPAVYADDGPERVSGKEKEVMQPAPPVCDLYRAHEWDLDIWGAYAFAADQGEFDHETNASAADPFTPDRDPGVYGAGGSTTISQPASQNPDERVNLGRITKNEIFGRDDTWGGGVDVKYFWSKYFGAGVEAFGLAAKTNFLGGGLATLTGRYPFGRFAPYVTGGLGIVDGGATIYQFYNEQNFVTGNVVTDEKEFLTYDPVYNNHVRALGQIGAGLEYRVTCHIGLMADFTWNFVFGPETHAEKIGTLTEQGTITTFPGGKIQLQPTVITVINTAHFVKPEHGSDHQDFGMARFGVTFSY